MACNAMESVKFSNGITNIGKRAFSGCENLLEVVLPNSVRTIGERAFYRCYRLNKIDFGKGLVSIGERAFYQCESLCTLDMPDSLVTIGPYAFYKCTNIGSVKIGGRVTEIGNYAFYKCTNLVVVVIPESVTSIGAYAFRGCVSLRSVTLGSSITNIGSHAFYGCGDMTIYSSATQEYANWSSKWNSSFKPVVWGCEIVEGNYVYSITVTQNTISNSDASGGVVKPVRKGYEFEGWATEVGGEVVYNPSDITTGIEQGTTLYAVWREKTEEELKLENPDPPPPNSVGPDLFGWDK